VLTCDLLHKENTTPGHHKDTTRDPPHKPPPQQPSPLPGAQPRLLKQSQDRRPGPSLRSSLQVRHDGLCYGWPVSREPFVEHLAALEHHPKVGSAGRRLAAADGRRFAEILWDLVWRLVPEGGEAKSELEGRGARENSHYYLRGEGQGRIVIKII